MPDYIDREEAKRLLVSDYAYAAADLLDKVPSACCPLTAGGIAGGSVDWISAKTRLPESDTPVLCWYEYFRYGKYNKLHRTYGIAQYFKDNWFVDGGCSDIKVLAWTPLPEPPEEVRQ